MNEQIRYRIFRAFEPDRSMMIYNAQDAVWESSQISKTAAIKEALDAGVLSAGRYWMPCYGEGQTKRLTVFDVVETPPVAATVRVVGL